MARKKSPAGVTFKGKCNHCHDIGHKKVDSLKQKDKKGGSSNNSGGGNNSNNNNNVVGGNLGTSSGNSNRTTKQFKAHVTNATSGDMRLSIAGER